MFPDYFTECQLTCQSVGVRYTNYFAILILIYEAKCYLDIRIILNYRQNYSHKARRIALCQFCLYIHGLFSFYHLMQTALKILPYCTHKCNLHLEHLTKPKSDQSGSKGEKSQMDISPAFISDEQAPVSMEPGKGSLNNPAVLSKMRGTVHPTSGNAVLYMSHCARLSAKRKIVPFISVKFLRMTSGSPVQISQGRQMIQHIFQHFAIIHIGGSEADNKRNSIAIRYEMMFTSRTTSIYGVGSCVFAPLFAWMTEPSIQALLQSIFFVSCKFCRMTW